MKKYPMFSLLIFSVLPLYIPLLDAEIPTQEPEPLVSVVFEIEGTGYSFPTGTSFIFGPRLIIWYSTSGTTISYIPDIEIHNPHFGICFALVGLWQAPRLIQQPGEVSGMCFGLALIIPVENISGNTSVLTASSIIVPT